MDGNVVVAVRVRPLNSREIARRAGCVVKVDGQQTMLTPPTGPDKNGRKAQVRAPKAFTFDHSYNSIDKASDDFASQDRLFQDLGVELLARAFDGYNCCIFAYGQTGSGKSYTMMGYKEDKGMIPMICEDLFRRIAAQQDNVQSSVEVSYLEIYSEQVRDLLNPKNKGGLRIREHPVTGPYVEDLSKLVATSYQDIENLMLEGNKARTVASTNMNETSSRSHAVFSIVLTQRCAVAGIDTEKVSKISLVDLAGSERANSTGAIGARLKEGAEINRSLSTLGRVISALAEKANRRQGNIKTNVPYRDSVLTWLLKDSLGGNSLTTMIATISPAEINYEETLSTLRYADSAKRIFNHAVVNEDQNLKMIRELKEELSSLRAKMSLVDDATEESRSEQMLSITSSDGTVKFVSKAEVVERMEQSAKIMDEINLSWEQKLQNTQQIQREREQALEDLGIQLGQTDTGSGLIGVSTPKRMPHLVNLSEDPLLTELLVYNLKPGTTLCGKADHLKTEIKLSGQSILSEHCVFENSSGIVSVRAMNGATVMVNGLRITDSKRLKPGYRIIIGDEALHIFRFNNPEEARAERAKRDTGPETPSRTSKSRSKLITPEFEANEPDWANSSRSRSTPISPVRDNEYLYARREAAGKLLNDADIGDLADDELDELFNSLQRVKAGRLRTRASSSRLNYPQRISGSVDADNESADDQPGKRALSVRSSYCESRYLEGSDTLSTHNSVSSPLRSSGRPNSLSAERERKRISDSERMMQLLNAARLEAESKGEIEQVSVVERLYAVKLDAERQLDIQEFESTADPECLKSTNTMPKSPLVSKAFRQWQSLADVRLSRTILDHSVLLKVAQIMTSNINDSLSLQFAILHGPYLPVSPLENDHAYDYFHSIILNGRKSAEIVIRILDYARCIVYFSTIKNLRSQVKRLNETTYRQEQRTQTKDAALFEKPFPRYSIVGQAAIPLIMSSTLGSKMKLEIDVFSPHTHVQSGIIKLELKMTTSETDTNDMVTVHLEIVSLTGFTEKEVTDVHIHAFFDNDLERRLTTESVSNFGDSSITFNSRHSCQIFKDDLPDFIQFQVFGTAKQDFLDRLLSWDELQEACLGRPEAELIEQSIELPIICRLQIAEIDHTGKYAPCEVFAIDSDDVGYFYLHQGLSRRLHLSLSHQNGQRLTLQGISSIEICSVRTTDLQNRSLIRESGSDTVILKMVSVGTPSAIDGPTQDLTDVVAQWDSSMHNTISLDCTTPTESIIKLIMNMSVATAQFGLVVIAVEVFMRIHGRDQQPSYLSRYFTSSRISNEMLQVFLLPANILGALSEPSLSSISHVHDPLVGQDILEAWKPRGISLVQGHRKMLEAQNNLLAVRETRMRYGLSSFTQTQMIPGGTQSQSSASKQLPGIIRYLQIKAKIHSTSDLTAQVIASYPPSVSNLPVIHAATLSPEILQSGHLHIRNFSNTVKKYYFVLRRPYFLQYSSSSQHKLLSIINLRGSSCTSFSSGNAEVDKATFSVAIEGHVWRYQASSRDARDAWINAIQSASSLRALLPR